MIVSENRKLQIPKKSEVFMDQNYTNNLLPIPNSKVPDTQDARPRNPILRLTVGAILTFVLAVAA